MRIRFGVPDDVSQLTRVAVNAISGSGYSLEQREVWSKAFTDAYVAQVISDNVVIVVEIDDAVAGFASLKERDETGGLLDLLYVDPQFSRRGVGKLLIRSIEDEARRQEMDSIWVDASDPAMHRLQQLGYRARRKNVKTVASVTFHNTWMAKTFL